MNRCHKPNHSEKKRYFIRFHTRDWKLFTTWAHYNSTLQPGTSGSTDTTRITAPDSGQRFTQPKINPIEWTNTHTLHALCSIRKHIVHIFKLPSIVLNVYSHESYNTYPHITDYRYPCPLTCWTYCPVVKGILIYIFSSHEFNRCRHLLIFLIRELQLTRICHRIIHTTYLASSYLLLCSS